MDKEDLLKEKFKSAIASTVKVISEKKNLERCKIYLVDCQIFKPQGEQLSNLLEGELRIDKTNYQYIGSDIV